MGANRVAVVGVGQTKYAAVRGDVSLPGLLREAAYRALDDAHMTMDDIDAIVVGKAPDFFEGMMMPEAYLAEALGAVGKPLFRVHTAGSVGGSTAIVAASHIESGVHERVLTIGWEHAVVLRGHVGAVVPASRSSSSWWPVPAATSPRSSASTCGVRTPPTTSASWWR